MRLLLLILLLLAGPVHAQDPARLILGGSALTQAPQGWWHRAFGPQPLDQIGRAHV